MRDVIVVGGGVAGLTVAWELRSAGVDVVMIEARDRIGGACPHRNHRHGDRRLGYHLGSRPGTKSSDCLLRIGHHRRQI